MAEKQEPWMCFGSSNLAHYPTKWLKIEQEIIIHSFILCIVPNRTLIYLLTPLIDLAPLFYLLVFLLDSFGADKRSCN